MPEIREVIRILTLDNFDESAAEPARQCLVEGAADAQAASVSAHNYLAEHWDSIRSQDGLIDAWIGAVIFITFAQGVAVGRGRKELRESDVSLARKELCTRFPACFTMRLESAISALEHLAGSELSGPGEAVGGSALG